MRGVYAQSRSNHRRGFTGVLLRREMRGRGGHDNRILIRLIDAIQASQMLRLSPSALELGAQNGLIPHYRIGEQTRFDPVELDRWIQQHKVDVLAGEDDLCE